MFWMAEKYTPSFEALEIRSAGGFVHVSPSIKENDLPLIY